MSFSWMMRWAVGVAAIAALAWPGAAEARWLKAESKHFVVYSEGDPKALEGYVQRLEVFDALLRNKLGAKGDLAPLPIYLVRNEAELRRVYPDAQENVAGFYSAGSEDVFVVALRERKSDRTLFHEYTHHFMLGHFPYSYPGWLVEGWAEYFTPTEIGDKWVDFGGHDTMRTSWLQNAKWLPFELVLRRRPFELTDANARALYYAQAWWLTHWFLSDAKRQPQLVAYMKAVNDGGDPVTALEAAAGMPLAELERTLRIYLRSGYKYTRTERGSLGRDPVKITTLPASADALLLEAQRVKRFGADAAFAGAVRAKAAQHPGDRLAELTLARAEIAAGNLTAAEAVLERRLAADAADAEALELMGTAALKAAEVEKDPKRRATLLTKAKTHLVRSLNADIERFQPHYLLAEASQGERGYPTDAHWERLKDAYDLAPQVAAVRFEFARALMLDEKYEEAADVLGPLVNSPHGGEGAAAARALLAQLRAKGGGAQD